MFCFQSCSIYLYLFAFLSTRHGPTLCIFGLAILGYGTIGAWFYALSGKHALTFRSDPHARKDQIVDVYIRMRAAMWICIIFSFFMALMIHHTNSPMY